MAKIMIWPDLYKEHGHWLPCITLARTLIARGHTVSFMGIPDCESIVKPYMVTTSAVPYHTILSDIYKPGYSIDEDLEPKGQRWKPHHVLPICRKESGPGIGIDDLFKSTNPDRPDLLISGYFNSLENLIIHHLYGIPFVTMTTYLRHPQDIPEMLVRTKLVYMSKPLSQKIIDLATGSSTSTIDIDGFLEPLSDPSVTTELLPCSDELDFTDEDWVHAGDNKANYVEPMLTRTKFDGSPATTVFDSGGTPIIFGTAGSMVQDYQSRAREFFTNLISMMKLPNMQGYDLVLSVGDKLLPALNVQYGVDTNTSTLPANVRLFSWVSQLEVLEKASAIFTHGGLATIKEAISQAVPIIVIPHGKDQLDNALRLQRNGLGVVAQVQDTAPESLKKLFTTATTSTWIQQNLTKMQTIFNKDESDKPSVGYIEGLL